MGYTSTKQVVTYRVCDKCSTDVQAEETHRFALNGARYEIDLCADHGAELYGQIMEWADLGTQVAEPTVFDRPRRVTALVQTIQTTPTVHELTPAQTTSAHDQWLFTEHALERMEERGFDADEVLQAVVTPREVLPADEKFDPKSVRIHCRDGCKAVVDLDRKRIITVLPRNAVTPQPVQTIAIDQRVRA